MIQTFSFLLLVFSVGCALFSRGERITGLDRPLTELQRAVHEAMPVGVARVSRNGREFTSEPYAVGKRGPSKPPGDAPVRYIVQAYVLGDRRPYVIEIFVYQERKKSGGYVKGPADEVQTKVMRTRIERELAKRRDDRNVVDDFRVF